MSSYSSGASLSDVSLKDLYNWLRNPIQNRKKLISLSRYYYAKDGIVTDLYDTFCTLPRVTHSMCYENMDNENYPKEKAKVDKFKKNIRLNKLIKDTIFETIQDGTCVWYNRSNKFIQFLDDDEYVIDSMVNGKWQVRYDLSYFDQFQTVEEIQNAIKSAPNEVTLRKYNAYKKDRNKQYVDLDIKRTQVIKLRGSRNVPYGIPYCIPALSAILHKDLLERSEKAIADRITNQIIVQKIGNMLGKDGKTNIPLPETAVRQYHNNLKKLLQKKYTANSNDNSSVAPLTVPEFVSIEELKINMNTFPKEIWDRIDRNIYQKLGYSQSLSSGGGSGSSFGSSTINVEKIYSIIHFIIDQIEDGLNEYIENIVTTPELNPKLWISRTTILDKNKQFEQAEALYLKGRGSWKHYVESAGYSADHYLAQSLHEVNDLKLDEVLPTHQTSFTQSGDNKGAGRPESDSSNDNTDRSKGNGANDNPSPSDS